MRKRQASGAVLMVGALGVVFGDIGASPIYALQTLFKLGGLPLTREAIFGVISLIVWALILVVSVKYISMIMRADNDGEGGILALLGLLRKKMTGKAARTFLVIGFLGLAFFYADSVITPAVSVLAAVEGIKVALPEFSNAVVPLAVIILLGIFLVQSRGSGVLGRVFGPIMVAWFVASGAAGLVQIIASPDVLIALLPTTAAGFALTHPLLAFVGLTAVTLAMTGAEALYADMGHFGRRPIRASWFLLVLPVLIMNYLGQGALVALHPEAAGAPYFLLYPEQLRIPIIILATLATINASMAVIAGAFSLTRQAVRLGFVPPMIVKHTSLEEVGQVYLTVINWLMCGLVVLLVLIFGSSAHLAAALAVAVTGAWLVDSLLFFAVMHYVNGWSRTKVSLIATGFLAVDMLLVVSNIPKLAHGGWVPLVFAALAMVILTTWTRGHEIVGRERQRMEGRLEDFVAKLRRMSPPVPRIEGSAVYLSHHAGFTPLALRATVKQLHELSSNVVIVSVKTLEVPHVPLALRAKIDELGYIDDGISAVRLEFGFNDVPNVPLALEHIRGTTAELEFDPYKSSYFVSDSDLAIVKNHRMSRPRKVLYALLARNATSSVKYFHLPTDRTVDMATYIEL